MANPQQEVTIYRNKAFSTAQSQFEKDLRKRQGQGWRLISITPTRQGFLTAIYERDTIAINNAFLPGPYPYPANTPPNSPYSAPSSPYPADRPEEIQPESSDIHLIGSDEEAQEAQNVQNPYEPIPPSAPDISHELNPDELATSPLSPSAPPYSKILFLGLIGTLFLAFLVIGSGESLPDGINVPFSIGFGLFCGLLVSMFIIDWKGLLTVENWIKWRQMDNKQRIGMGCLLYCLFPIFLCIYLIRIGLRVFQAKGPIFSSEWYAPAPMKRRTNIGLIVGAITALFLIISTIMPLATTTSVSNTSSNTAHTVVASSTQATTPAPTPKPSPTAKPTPTPTLSPEQQSILQEGQDCALRSYQSDYNSDHTELTVIAASGVIDSQGNPQPWSTKNNLVEAGKAITFCLQKYLWTQEPDLLQIAVIVWGQMKSHTGKAVNVFVGGSLTQASATNFDWNQTPDQAWNKYDEQAIK